MTGEATARGPSPISGDVRPGRAHAHRGQVQLLDVREVPEWVAGHIEGAVHVPMRRLQADQDELATDRTIVCVCRSGHRSAAVAEALRRVGYDAVNLLGGMHAWAAEGLPFVAEGDREARVV